MNFDSSYFGPQGLTSDDGEYRGSRFTDIRDALFRNAYYIAWGARGERPLPVYATTLRQMLTGVLPIGRAWKFLAAARRTIASKADLRWGGPDRRGFRRILHPNGVCLFGTWEIDEQLAAETDYSGYFRAGSKCLIIARYSTGLGVERGDFRTLSMVGKLFPTIERGHPDPLHTANFITQEELGGARTRYINDAQLVNAPNTTPWRRHLRDLPKLLVLGPTFFLADSKVTIRQLYQIAELGKPDDEPTRAPEFMRLTIAPTQPRVEGNRLDFRDEILAQIYDKGDPQAKRTLTFDIEVSDEGRTKGTLVQRRVIKRWKHIGRIIFDAAVASYNGDFVIHFHHPPWRRDRNDPTSLARRRVSR